MGSYYPYKKNRIFNSVNLSPNNFILSLNNPSLLVLHKICKPKNLFPQFCNISKHAMKVAVPRY